MIALLFLGIIPGTNIQINFNSWLICTAVLLVLTLFYIAYRRKLAQELMILFIIRRAIRTTRLSSPSV
jgi:hypothetical protein